MQLRAHANKIFVELNDIYTVTKTGCPRKPVIKCTLSAEILSRLNPRPFSVFRHLRQWRGGGCDPPGVSKLADAGSVTLIGDNELKITRERSCVTC